MASGESSESMEYQTCILKVSIHCEGCKTKVKKVLRNIDGVREAHIDSQLNKVTVVSNVGADTLIKKLNKAGRPAELWPEKKPTNPNPNPNSNPNPDSNPNPNHNPNPNPNPNPNSSNSNKKKKSKGTSKSNNEPAGNPDEAKDGKANVEVPNSDDTEPTKPDAKEEEATDGAAPADGESGSKKKGKKGKKEGATGEEAAITEEITENAESPRHHRHLDEPLAYNPQPVSAYNMAHPTMSNSYYYSPAPMPVYDPQAYMYSHPPPESYYSSYPPAYPHVESYYTQPETGSSSSSAPAGSYDMFNDENANSCKVM